MYLAYRRDDSDAQQAEAECYKVKPGEKEKRQMRLTGDDRRTGKTYADLTNSWRLMAWVVPSRDDWKRISLRQTVKRCAGAYRSV
jgi:hypothetical protein